MKKYLYFLLFLVFFSESVAQQLMREIKGKVVDLGGQPIVGASVFAVGGKIGTVTNETGEFYLRLPEEVKWLTVSCVGRETRKIVVEDPLWVVLQEQKVALEELLVVAYETTEKQNYSGAAVSLQRKEISKRPVTVITSSLEGQFAGVQVAEGNGQPGSDMHIRIRGYGSVNADNEPLYVVDGAVYAGALCDINPYDIETLTVLKDAVATALYGSGAGNGVVLITTRSARQEKPTLSFSMKQGFNDRSVAEYDRVSLREYYPLQWEMMRNGLISAGQSESEASQAASTGVYEKVKYNPFRGIPSDEIVLPDGRLHPEANALLYGDDLDWEKAIRRKGYRGEYNLSYGMQNTKGDLYAGLGYLKEKGYVIGSGLERFSGRLNVNLKPVEWLKTGLGIAYVRTNCELANTQDNASDAANPFYFTRYIGPVYPIHQHRMTDGAYITDLQGNKLYDYEEASRGSNIPSLDKRNIVAETQSNKNAFERNGINGRVYADLFPVKGLKATVRFTVDSYDYRREKYENNRAASSPGRLEASSIRTTSLTANQLLNYKRNIGAHEIDVLAGHESYAYRYEYLYGNKQDQFLEDVYEMYNFQTLGRLNSYTDTYRKEGYFVRLNYNYAQRYGLAVAYRRDGSSRFKAGERWGNFGSIGVVWNIDREKFMEKLNFVDVLRGRASYGETGNDRVLQSTSLPNTFSDDYYPYQSFYKIGVNNAKEPGLAFYRFGNADLKWEAQTAWNVALEMKLFHRLEINAEYFRKDSKHLLFEVTPTLSSGVSSIWENIGKVSNRGWELEVTLNLLDMAGWHWDLGVNATFWKNKILKMPPTQPEWVEGTRKLRKGSPLYNYWLKEYRGVDPATGDAQYTFDRKTGVWDERNCYVDAQGDSLTYNSLYAKYHDAGSPIPKVYGGIHTTLAYRNLTLTAVLTYSIGGKVYNTGYQVLMYNSKYGQALHKDILRRWQKPGDITDVPRLEDTERSKRTGLYPVNQINAVSDRWLFDAGYWSVKSLTLNYRLPMKLLYRLGLTNANVFISGENLWLLTALKGMDPRQAYKGLTTVAYTPARTFTFGFTLTL